jgi:hypothetical protein
LWLLQLILLLTVPLLRLCLQSVQLRRCLGGINSTAAAGKSLLLARRHRRRSCKRLNGTSGRRLQTGKTAGLFLSPPPLYRQLSNDDASALGAGKSYFLLLLRQRPLSPVSLSLFLRRAATALIAAIVAVRLLMMRLFVLLLVSGLPAAAQLKQPPGPVASIRTLPGS